MTRQVEKSSGVIFPVLSPGDTQVMFYKAVELPTLPAAAAHCRSPEGGIERLWESLDGISGITLLWGGIAVHTYSGSHTAEGQLVIWEQG